MEDVMNVQELIDALSKVSDKSLPVIAEGCDCANLVSYVEAHSDEVWIGVDL